MVRMTSGRFLVLILFFASCSLYFTLLRPSQQEPPSTSPPHSMTARFGTRYFDLQSDVFISVKTTLRFHESRVGLILSTWFHQLPNQIFFFTDSVDDFLSKQTNGHLIQSNCSASHSRKALCCKMSVEMDTFLKSDDKWFCHFDDDNYVNVPRLLDLLQSYDPRDDWYLGKPSIRHPLQILDRKTGSKFAFWFGTGGAGFCLSRSLVMKMTPFASGGKFMSTCDKIRLPDDVTVGYIIQYLLHKPLTVVEHFHSHLEPANLPHPEEQISMSFSQAAVVLPDRMAGLLPRPLP